MLNKQHPRHCSLSGTVLLIHRVCGPSDKIHRRSVNGKATGQYGLEDDDSDVRLGQRVRHGKFGDGVILNCEGQGAHARVEVNFENAGTKWLVLSYANLNLM